MPALLTRRHLFYALITGAAALPLTNAALARPKGKSVLVYFGTYTNGKSKGIYLYNLDAKTGALTDTGLTAMTPNPSFLAIAPNRKFLYAVNEIGSFNGKEDGSVTAFAIDAKTGGLTALNTEPSAGTYPCHIQADARGEHVLVANYGSGSVASLPILTDGKLAAPVSISQHTGSSADKSRQEGPHAHSVYTDATGRFALAADLGTDKIYVYKYDAKQGKLTPNEFASADLPPGSGPRHLAEAADHRYLYAINEMLNTVAVFEWNEKRGELKTIQSVPTLPADFHAASTTAEIFLTPNGRFLYASNRGHNSLAIFRVAAKTGLLHSVGWQSVQGKTPRSFAIDPTGNILIVANQDTDNVVTFHINPETGALTPTGNEIAIPAPVCVLFAPQ